MDKFPTKKELFHYDNFNKKQREDVYNFCKNLSKYLEAENIENLIFVDRAARAAWIGVSEYWKKNFKEKEKPNMYFINPDGFDVDRIVQDEMRADRLNYVIELLGFKDLLFESLRTKEVSNNIKSHFQEVYPELFKRRVEPLVIFDTCAHTGDTVGNVVRILDSLGFADVRIITANEPDIDSGIIPAAKIDKKKHYTTCYPFLSDGSLVSKTNDIISTRTDNMYELERGVKIREEIKHIISDGK